MSAFSLDKIQEILNEMNFDAWLFFDFRGSNDLAHEILNIPHGLHLTRRFFYFVPKKGEPVKIVNGIEAFNLDHLPGRKITYSNRESLEGGLHGARPPNQHPCQSHCQIRRGWYSLRDMLLPLHLQT